MKAGDRVLCLRTAREGVVAELSVLPGWVWVEFPGWGVHARAIAQLQRL